MKKYLLSALLASVAIPAFAADMPVKAPIREPILYTDWSGIYVGGAVGGAWGREKLDTDLSNFDNPNAASSSLFTTGAVRLFESNALIAPPFSMRDCVLTNCNSTKMNGIMAGGFAGAQKQLGNWVIGIEGSWDWLSLKKNLSASETDIETVTRTVLTNTAILPTFGLTVPGFNNLPVLNGTVILPQQTLNVSGVDVDIPSQRVVVPGQPIVVTGATGARSITLPEQTFTVGGQEITIPGQTVTSTGTVTVNTADTQITLPSQTITVGGQTVTIPGQVLTLTGTSSVPGGPITIPAQTVNISFTVPVLNIPVTIPIPIPATTVTIPTLNGTAVVTGSSAPVPITLPSQTFTVGGQTITIPGQSVTANVTVTGQTQAQTFTVPSQTITVGGQTITIPGQTITSVGSTVDRTIIVPGQTVNVNGQTVTIPRQVLNVVGGTVTVPGQVVTVPAQNVILPGTGIPVLTPQRASVTRSVEVTSKIDQVADIRGKFGITNFGFGSNFLLYATGGASIAHIQHSLDITQTTQGINAQGAPIAGLVRTNSFNSVSGDTRLGWVVGAGLDWKPTQNLVLGVLYRHHEFPKGTVTFSEGTNSLGFGTSRVSMDSVQGRLSVLFPVQ